MNEPHPRLHSFSVNNFVLPWNPGDTLMDVLLFRHDMNLRSHAVGHFANLAEFAEWRKMMRIGPEEISSAIDKLRDIGCPYFSMVTHRPPCRAGDGRCRLFDMCTPAVLCLEENYQAMIKEVIFQGCDIPRSAFFTDLDGSGFCWILPDVKLIAKMVWQPPLFNLMTCYRPQQGARSSWSEVRDYVARKIRNESRSSVIWCIPQTWGLEENHSRGKKAKHHRQKRKIRTGRQAKNDRGGGKTWRRYWDN